MMIQLLCPPDSGELIRVCTKLGSSQVVSLIGAGGKTSTLYWLANEMARRGLKVLVTTTTHMFLPDQASVARCIIEADFNARLAALKSDEPGIVACFTVFDEKTGKVKGCSPEEVCVLKNASFADVILVEADGARHCALKVPAEHEPSVPKCSDVVIAVSGGEVMLRPADPERVHRWGLFSALTGIKAGDVLDREVFDRLLTHPDGAFKNTPEHAARHWLVNMVKPRADVLSMLQSLMQGHPELDGLWLGNMRQEQALMAAWLRKPE